MTRTNQDSCMSSLTSNAPPTPTTSTPALNHANCWDDTACSASSNPKDKDKNIGDDDQSGDSRGQKRKWKECNREEDEVDRTKIETPLMFSSMEQPSKKQKKTEVGVEVPPFAILRIIDLEPRFVELWKRVDENDRIIKECQQKVIDLQKVMDEIRQMLVELK